MSDHDSIDSNELLAIEAHVNQLVRDIERRAKRAGKVGCAWLVIVVISAFTVRHANGLITWGVFSVGSFVALGRFLKNDASRSVAEFQRTFRSSPDGGHRRELALNYLRRMAATKGGTSHKHAQKLLDRLGVVLQSTTPLVSEPAGDGVLFPAPIRVVIDETPGSSVPTPPHVTHMPKASAPRSVPPLPMSATRAPYSNPVRTAASATHEPRHVAPSAPADVHSVPVSTRPAHVAPFTAPTPAATTHVPTANLAPAGGSDSMPTVEPRAAELSGVVGPPPSAPHARAPASTSGAVTGELVSWRCDACGTEARVPRSEAHRLCPTCFPQIRLET